MATYQDLKSVAYIGHIIRFVENLLGIRFKQHRRYRYSSHCPFHSDSKDSFRVYVNKGGEVRFRCFGACKKEWDAYDLIQRMNKCSFREAQHVLARYIGDDQFQAYQAKHSSPADENPMVPVAVSEPEELDAEIAGALDDAFGFYHRLLMDNQDKYEAVLKYLNHRGVSEALVAMFGIGYAPAFNDDKYEGRALLLAHLDEFHHDYLTFNNYRNAGLFRHLDTDGSPYQRYVDYPAEWGIYGGYGDYFAGRMTFPIRGIDGRPQGLVGRRPDQRGIRWMKQQAEGTDIRSAGWLYGIDKAARHIAHYKTIILVEGIFDYFAFLNIFQDQGRPIRPIVVSTLGSALTDEALAIIRSLGVEHFIVAYDCDEAGKNAIFHIAGVVGTSYFLGGLEEGQDPADKLKVVAPYLSGFSLQHLLASAKKHQAQTEKPIHIEHILTGSPGSARVRLAPVSTLDKQAMKAAKTPLWQYYNAEDFLPLLRYDHGNKASMDATIDELIQCLQNAPGEDADAKQFRIKTDFITNEFYHDMGQALILWLRIAIEQQTKKRRVKQTDSTLADWLHTSRKTVSGYKAALKSLGYLNIDTTAKVQRMSVSLVPKHPDSIE